MLSDNLGAESALKLRVFSLVKPSKDKLMNLRQDLSTIVRELQAPFAAIDHSIRKLPGGNLYIYLNWEVVRDRLLAVVPDHELDYTVPNIDLVTNRCICKATITILGVSKSELGDVPVSEKNNDGRETTRGTACDRSKAEAFKNAAEAWGVGSYLNDQYFCYKILEADKANISEDYRNKLNAIASQLKTQLSKGEVRSRAFIASRNGKSNDLLVSTTVSTPRPKPQPQAQQPSNVVTLTKTEYLYPTHNSFTTGFLDEFGFPDVRQFVMDAIASEYPDKKYPGDLPREDFIGILALTVARWATVHGHFQDTSLALTAFQGRISVIEAAQGSLTLEQFKQEAIAWRNNLLVS